MIEAMIAVGESNRTMMLRVDGSTLQRDERYQRDEVSGAKTEEMGRNYSPEAVGDLTVGHRADGTYWVVDGWQRLLAMRFRGDIKTTRCTVFESRGVEHEREVFGRININRTPLNVYDKFNNQALRGEQPYAEVNDCLRKLGLQVKKIGTTGTVKFPGVVVRTWQVDKLATERALQWQKDIWPVCLMHNSIHKGLWYLHHHNLLTASHMAAMKRIRKQHGVAVPQTQEEYLRAIDQSRVDANQRSPNTRLCARGLKVVINKLCRDSLIRLPDSDEDDIVEVV